METIVQICEEYAPEKFFINNHNNYDNHSVIDWQEIEFALKLEYLFFSNFNETYLLFIYYNDGVGWNKKKRLNKYVFFFHTLTWGLLFVLYFNFTVFAIFFYTLVSIQNLEVFFLFIDHYCPGSILKVVLIFSFNQHMSKPTVWDSNVFMTYKQILVINLV